MGWLRSVGSVKLQVSFTEYCLFYRALLQKRPIILLILLTEATPYSGYIWSMYVCMYVWMYVCIYIYMHVHTCIHICIKIYIYIFNRGVYKCVCIWIYMSSPSTCSITNTHTLSLSLFLSYSDPILWSWCLRRISIVCVCVCVCVYIYMDTYKQTYIYSQSHLGWHFQKLKAQSSKLKGRMSLLPRFIEKRRSSFEFWALKQHSKMSPQVELAV